MARFFTWHDIEIVLMEQYASWPESWIDVRVYSDCVEIYHQKDSMIRQRTQDFLKKVYTKNYSIEDNSLLVDFTQTYLDVYLQETDEEKREIQGRPLFKEIYLDRFQKQSVQTELPGARILAFHSYKGGVGRTLSLISLLRQCTEQYPDKKILVIDADLEAPGLTWMLEDRGRSQVSYLDILSVLNYGQNTDLDLIHLAGLIKTSTVIVTTEKTEQEQYFIPVYREKKQMWDISSSPERILATKENRYYITETISRLGKELGADLIIVDLRAGITEYSAPFLFDPRVEKIYVTSTSLQSVKGLNQILEQIYGKTDSNLLKSKVLMTMIPQAMPEERMEAIKDQILADIEARFDGKYSTFLRENYIIPVEFEDALIHIGDFSSVCRQLQNKRITDTMQTLAEDLFRQEEKEEDLSQNGTKTEVIYPDGTSQWVMINAYIAKNSYDYTGLVYEEPYMRYYADGKKASRQGVKIDDSCGTVNFVQVEEDGIDYCIIRIGKRGYATGAISLDENYLTYMKEAKEAVDGAPKVLKEQVSKEEADGIKAKLEEVGAKVTLK